MRKSIEFFFCSYPRVSGQFLPSLTDPTCDSWLRWLSIILTAAAAGGVHSKTVMSCTTGP